MTDHALAADGGPLKDGLTVHFSTVPLPQIVKINPPNAENTKGGGFDGSLSIQFASPMRLDSLKDRVVLTPAPSNPVQWYYSDYDWTYRMYGLDPGTDYVVRIRPGMTDIYGNAIGSESSLNFSTADMAPYARLVMPYTPLVYRAHGPQEAYFEYTNLDSATVSLYPLTFAEFTGLVHQDDKTVFAPQVQPLREWRTDAATPRNQLGRLHIKLEDPKGNSLPPGYYLLGVTSPSLHYSWNFYQVSLLVVATDNITFKASSNEGLAWVVDLETGKPQANVPVTFYDKDLVQVGATVSTDPNGLAYLSGINAPSVRPRGGRRASGLCGNRLGQRRLGRRSRHPAELLLPHLPRLSSISIPTGPLYRPGQDVYFKGLVRQNDDLHYSLLKDAKVYVTIEQSGEKVYEKYLPLSQLGSVQDDFKLVE